MNTPIIRLFLLTLLLFAALVAISSKWAVFEAEELKDKTENRRALIVEQQIPRGSISTSDGVLLAESLPEGEGNRPVFVRRYPAEDPATFGNPVGYSYVEVGRTGIELAENDLLSGEQNEFASIVDQLRDVPPEGADITLTLDAASQRLAVQQLEAAAAPGVGGSVVALDPETGAVKVLASIPGFDPNTIDQQESLSELEGLFFRATQSTYTPGSTMKVVTAVAALDSGQFEPDTTLEANSGKMISGQPLANSGGTDFGTIDMTTALTNSVNTYWAQVGVELGTGTMTDYMKRFGMYADPKLNYPDGQMAPSGVINSSGDPVEEGYDVGRVAIGQGGEEGQASMTPLQMAEVAAAVANGGDLMKPNLLQEAEDADGRTIDELDPDRASGVMSDETAEQVTEMMVNVTEEGTAAGLSVGGVSFAGKTGTAEIDVAAGINRPWFIGFAPADDPQVAVAAMIEQCQGCTGGEVAGPIATAVMQSLLEG